MKHLLTLVHCVSLAPPSLQRDSRRRSRLHPPWRSPHLTTPQEEPPALTMQQKTAVFTPAYGSVTNVRINSCMSTPQVLRVLLNKFKIENSPDDFALYLVHTSGVCGTPFVME
ncbi:hypothetical protein NHX12_028297 [Muraenolepis orangiensis]|uniref:Ras-associating domain-containing protein n=1 Tax=Muraenolepis orangiensis TaxID=630683 RepID=A0A9Q0IK58_9TELE|nr:hypothetical protein NHX12_028297 [Muraenolepis orangiensis]